MLTKEEIREALVERHSEEVQSKLDKAKVAIAGLGGLGSNVAYALARIGVGHLHLIDFDVVDITNLNRQQYFTEEKAMLVNGVLEHFPEKKLVSATGMAGYGSSNTIRTKRLMKNFYLCGDGVTEPEYGNGLMAPRVAICAAHEANMITRLILGEEEI